MLRFFLFCALVIFQSTAFSQTRKIKLDSNKRLILEYASKAWNKNPNDINKGALILRDALSKKIARVEVFETDLDSAFFRGQFLINWGEDEVALEVYLPPSGMGKTTEQLNTIELSIEDGTLLRKPFFVRSNSKSQQTLTVFDTKEQALQAYDNYIKLNANRNTVNPDTLQKQASLEKQSEINNQQKLEKEKSAQRESIEQEEARKRKQLQERQESLNAAERESRKRKATDLAKKALDLYGQQNYLESEKLFAEAVELDPSNSSFYYQYAIVLFKNDKNQKSVALFKLANSSDINEAEKKYYLGLNYVKMQELDHAAENFQASKDSKDKSLGPASAFYLGIIKYQKEQYDEAKKEFEYVLDNSSDPNMDKQAETYIEQIANAMAFKKEQEKKFILSLNFGLMYDSNILAVQNSIAGSGSPTDLAGYRWMYGGVLQYRPIYNYTNEFSVNLYANDMYSTDNNFAAKKSFQDTDPLTMGISAPYKIKGNAFGKAYQGSLTPGYETIQMNADTVGARESIVNSTYLKTDHTFVMSETLFSTYLAEIRQDSSQLTSSEADDQTATKYTLGTVQTKFQDSKKTEAIIGDFSLSQNNAKGGNSKFTRYDLGLAYMMPWKWETSFTSKLAYYDVNYPDHATGRRDRDTSLILGLSKPLSDKLSASLTGIYTINQSTLESSDYKKYMIMTNFSWSTAL